MYESEVEEKKVNDCLVDERVSKCMNEELKQIHIHLYSLLKNYIPSIKQPTNRVESVYSYTL